MSNPVGSVKRGPHDPTRAHPGSRQAEAEAWLQSLRSGGREREDAAARLDGLLVKAARFELLRRRAQWNRSGESLDDLAVQSADSALSALLSKLDHYRFESRFTTWAYKFAILEAAQLARRRAWQERELPIGPEEWDRLAESTPELAAGVAVRDQLRRVMRAIQTQLSAHQREVLTELVLAEVPIDVLAERLNTTRGALYKTLHDARRKLRDVVGSEADD
ncbi:MAG: sigma-70 family RNA polymerase sigma factor [Solirubrobacterales bacterium]|nr:sigma-70 family RNA polymerase sigma factor [Solirubrobacterales bacterium]MBV9714042.1 sigma-70 family RNA polymerase sigma factor [Solirubrobacterales bacterium]